MTNAAVSRKAVLVVADDLFFAIRIESTLVKLGFAVKLARTRTEADDAAAAGPYALAIVTFAGRVFDGNEVTKVLKQTKCPPIVLGFMPHVQLLAARPAAKAAGCDLLVPNSSLASRLPQIVARLMAQDGAAPGALAEAEAIAGEGSEE